MTDLEDAKVDSAIAALSQERKQTRLAGRLFRVVPFELLEQLTAVFEEGAGRVGRYPWNWRDLPRAEYILKVRQAADRHRARQVLLPSELAVDKDSRQPHLVHLAANALIEVDLLMQGAGEEREPDGPKRDDQEIDVAAKAMARASRLEQELIAAKRIIKASTENLDAATKRIAELRGLLDEGEVARTQLANKLRDTEDWAKRNCP